MIYIFASVILFLTDKRKKYIARILRLTKSEPSKGNGKKVAALFNRIELWLKKNNINMDLEEFIILISILFSIMVIIGVINFQNPIIVFLISIFIIFVLFIVINIRRKKENLKLD